MALRLTVVYLLHVLPYVGLVRVFTRHCRSVISRWLVTTVTLLVAVRHQVTRPAVGVCCLCSGQQYSPPSPLQPALTSPPPPRIPFTAVEGRGRTGASRRRWQSVVLAGFGDGFWEMKLDTALKNGYQLPRYHFTFRQLDIPFAYWRHVVLSCKWVTSGKLRIIFHSREIENALRESIASNPARIIRYSRMRSMPYLINNKLSLAEQMTKHQIYCYRHNITSTITQYSIRADTFTFH